MYLKEVFCFYFVLVMLFMFLFFVKCFRADNISLNLVWLVYILYKLDLTDWIMLLTHLLFF